MRLLLLLLLLLPAVVLACPQGLACIEIYNKCPFTIWPGIQGSSVPANGGFLLDAGQARTIQVPNGWSAGRIWARRGCDGSFNCDTGFCGAGGEHEEGCHGRGGEPPASLAEFTLHGAGGQDYYDVSLVDGYNLPVFIEPKQGTFRTNGGQYDCRRAGGCVKDLLQMCPPELRKTVNGRTVGCKSACLAFNTDEYCCRGAHDRPETCKSSSWPKNYPAIFKDACPTAYSYAYDDHSSTFFCRGVNSPSPEYTVQFC